MGVVRLWVPAGATAPQSWDSGWWHWASSEFSEFSEFLEFLGRHMVFWWRRGNINPESVGWLIRDS